MTYAGDPITQQETTATILRYKCPNHGSLKPDKVIQIHGKGACCPTCFETLHIDNELTAELAVAKAFLQLDTTAILLDAARQFKQLTLDRSCLHIWERYTAQPEDEPPRQICRKCGSITFISPTQGTRCRDSCGEHMSKGTLKGEWALPITLGTITIAGPCPHCNHTKVLISIAQPQTTIVTCAKCKTERARMKL